MCFIPAGSDMTALRSIPAQNARPAPPSTMTRTVPASHARWTEPIASASASISSSDNALRAAGRFSTTVAQPSVMSVWTRSVTAAL